MYKNIKYLLLVSLFLVGCMSSMPVSKENNLGCLTSVGLCTVQVTHDDVRNVTCYSVSGGGIQCFLDSELKQEQGDW